MIDIKNTSSYQIRREIINKLRSKKGYVLNNGFLSVWLHYSNDFCRLLLDVHSNGGPVNIINNNSNKKNNRRIDIRPCSRYGLGSKGVLVFTLASQGTDISQIAIHNITFAFSENSNLIEIDAPKLELMLFLKHLDRLERINNSKLYSALHE